MGYVEKITVKIVVIEKHPHAMAVTKSSVSREYTAQVELASHRKNAMCAAWRMLNLKDIIVRLRDVIHLS